MVGESTVPARTTPERLGPSRWIWSVRISTWMPGQGAPSYTQPPSVSVDPYVPTAGICRLDTCPGAEGKARHPPAPPSSAATCSTACGTSSILASCVLTTEVASAAGIPAGHRVGVETRAETGPDQRFAVRARNGHEPPADTGDSRSNHRQSCADNTRREVATVLPHTWAHRLWRCRRCQTCATRCRLHSLVGAPGTANRLRSPSNRYTICAICTGARSAGNPITLTYCAPYPPGRQCAGFHLALTHGRSRAATLPPVVAETARRTPILALQHRTGGRLETGGDLQRHPLRDRRRNRESPSTVPTKRNAFARRPCFELERLHVGRDGAPSV